MTITITFYLSYLWTRCRFSISFTFSVLPFIFIATFHSVSLVFIIGNINGVCQVFLMFLLFLYVFQEVVLLSFGSKSLFCFHLFKNFLVTHALWLDYTQSTSVEPYLLFLFIFIREKKNSPSFTAISFVSNRNDLFYFFA